MLCIEADTTRYRASIPGTLTSESGFRSMHSALTYRASSCAFVASGHLILLQHARSELSSGVYLPFAPSTFASRLGASIRQGCTGSTKRFGLLPLGKVSESGADRGHASLEDWVRCNRNSNNRAVRMAHSVLERVQPSPRQAESSRGAPRRIPASLKVCFSRWQLSSTICPTDLTKLTVCL